jgi:hypothetical protein
LLAEVDVGAAVSGEWSRIGPALACAPSPFARIETGAPPAEEYDFLVEFTVSRGPGDLGRGEVFQFFPVADTTARWALWCADYHSIGFVFGPADIERSNPTWSRDPAGCQPDRRYLSVVEVRRETVRGWLDGRLLAEWRLAELPPDGPAADAVRPRDRTRLGVGAWQSSTTFHRIAVRRSP